MSNNPIVQVFARLLPLGMLLTISASASAIEDPLQKVQEAALAQLQKLSENHGWIEPKFEVEVVRSSRPIPVCPSGNRAESLDPRGISRMRFVLVCPGAQGYRYEVLARAKVSAKVAVAATDLMAGKILSLIDLLHERHDLTLTPDVFSDFSALEGLAARRTIRAGEMLRPNMVVAPTLVKRGDQVRIVARRDQIEVSMSGEALDNGGKGAMVRVRNSSGVQIRARVTDAGTVEPADQP